MRLTRTQSQWLARLVEQGPCFGFRGPNAAGTEHRLSELGLIVRVLCAKTIADDDDLRWALGLTPAPPGWNRTIIVATVAGMNHFSITAEATASLAEARD